MQQRPSSRREHQQQKPEAREIGSHTKFQAQQQQQQQLQQQQHQLLHQRQEPLRADEDVERYTYSRPVSPLIAPSVKARPSSVAEIDNHNGVGGNFINTNNNHNYTNNQHLERLDDNLDNEDSRSQSPISFLDSPGPLIQAQDLQGAAPIDATNPYPTNTNSATSQSNLAVGHRPAASLSSSTTAVSAAATQASAALRRELQPPSPPLTSAPSTSSQYDSQRGVFKPAISSAAHNEATKSAANKQFHPSDKFSTAYNNQYHQSSSSQGNKPPASPTEKKKKSWWSWGGGSKDSSAPLPKPVQPLPNLANREQIIQRDRVNRPPPPPAAPVAVQEPKVLRKKNKKPPSGKQEKKQQPYPNQLPTNNSPEPSIVSGYTHEEPELDDSQSDLTRDPENIASIGRQPQLTPVESRIETQPRPSLENFDPVSERSTKTASSQHSQQLEPGAQGKPSPAWEARLRQGQQPQHQRGVSVDESLTIRSVNPGTSSTRADSKRDGIFVSTSRPPSRQSIGDPPSPAGSGTNPFVHSRTGSSQNESQNKFMGSANNSSSTGRNGEPQNNIGIREGQYGSTLSVNNQQQQQPGSYRNTPQASPGMVGESSALGQDRNTPPPGANINKSKEDLGNLDMQQLASKHDELNEKYRKVKKYYFDKDAQVQQLQNQLAHQRLSQSRTNLDDNEYATRFARLDGAINNLAFNIRKDWKAVPSWLAHCVNKEATTIVTKEMTAVGRACISRWLVDEVFDRYFHPALEPHLSCQLKVIEKNIRRFLPPPQTDEEREALVAKMSNWRLSTLDGLKSVLESEESHAYRDELTKMLVVMLTEDLRDNLKEPAPPGLDAGVIGIIELAVGVAANIPYESRDIFVDYLMPGVPVNESIMKIEATLPVLTNPGELPPGEHDRRPSVDSGDDRSDDIEFGKDGNPKKKGMLGGLIGGREKTKDSQPKDNRVRFAAFMLVEVRGGKTVLVKAPVYV